MSDAMASEVLAALASALATADDDAIWRAWQAVVLHGCADQVTEIEAIRSACRRAARRAAAARLQQAAGAAPRDSAVWTEALSRLDARRDQAASELGDALAALGKADDLARRVDALKAVAAAGQRLRATGGGDDGVNWAAILEIEEFVGVLESAEQALAVEDAQRATLALSQLEARWPEYLSDRLRQALRQQRVIWGRRYISERGSSARSRVPTG